MKKVLAVILILAFASTAMAASVYRKTEKVNLQDTADSLRTVTGSPKTPWVLKWVGVRGYALHGHEVNETVNVYVKPTEGDTSAVLVKSATFTNSNFSQAFDIPLQNDEVEVIVTKPTGDTTATVQVSIRGER
jgi:hypothetical protein